MIRSAFQISALTFFTIGTVHASSPQHLAPAWKGQERPIRSGIFALNAEDPNLENLKTQIPCLPYGIMQNREELAISLCGDLEKGIRNNQDEFAVPKLINATFMMINGKVPEIKGDLRTNASIRIDFFDEYENTIHSQVVRYWYQDIPIDRKLEKKFSVEPLPNEIEQPMKELIVPTNGSLFMYNAHVRYIRDWIEMIKTESMDPRKSDVDPRILLPLLNPVPHAVRSLVTLTSQELKTTEGLVVKKKRWATNILKTESYIDILDRLSDYLFKQFCVEFKQVVLYIEKCIEQEIPKTLGEAMKEIEKRYYGDEIQKKKLSAEEASQMQEEVKQADKKYKDWGEKVKKLKAQYLEDPKIEKSLRKRVEEF